MADRLSVSLLLGHVFHNPQIRSIGIEYQCLILRPKGFISILSLGSHDREPESTPQSPKKLLPRKRRELDTDGFETHIVRLIRRLLLPAHTQVVAKAITAARGLV